MFTAKEKVSESKCDRCGHHVLTRDKIYPLIHPAVWSFVILCLIFIAVLFFGVNRSHAEIAPLKFEGIIIHHTATPNGKEYTLEQCNRDHQARGFESCGYSALLEPSGKLVVSRGYSRVGAHTRGFNSRFIGIAIVGTGTANRNQLRTLQEYIEATERTYGKMLILGHRDLGRTECPGEGIYKMIKSGQIR